MGVKQKRCQKLYFCFFFFCEMGFGQRVCLVESNFLGFRLQKSAFLLKLLAGGEDLMQIQDLRVQSSEWRKESFVFSVEECENAMYITSSLNKTNQTPHPPSLVHFVSLNQKNHRVEPTAPGSRRFGRPSDR